MASSYAEFIASKAAAHRPAGVDITVTDVHPMLHPWQAELVVWAAKVGRAAIWADTGLGKTLMQVEWARLIGERTLIVAPLAVCAQTVREAAKVGVTVTHLREGDNVAPGMYITNYEMADRFNVDNLDAVVLDEASILKQSTGPTRTMLVNHFSSVPYRLACTATPAPNDSEELTNQAEFLGVLPRVEMLATYFIHDDTGWRVKKHARLPMFKWMSSWAVAIRRPSDMGYPDDGYELPGLQIRQHLLDVDVVPDDQLFATDIGGVGGRAKVRRATLTARVEKTADLVNAQPDEQWVIWVALNDEQDYLGKLLGNDARSIDGRTPMEERVGINEDWIAGKFRVLLVKPGMYSFGMNWQHCANMAFVGLNDSFETYYQCIRRCYRYGQQRVVHAHIVLSQLEGQIAANVRRKESETAASNAALVAAMRATRQEIAQ